MFDSKLLIGFDGEPRWEMLDMEIMMFFPKKELPEESIWFDWLKMVNRYNPSDEFYKSITKEQIEEINSDSVLSKAIEERDAEYLELLRNNVFGALIVSLRAICEKSLKCVLCMYFREYKQYDISKLDSKFKCLGIELDKLEGYEYIYKCDKNTK